MLLWRQGFLFLLAFINFGKIIFLITLRLCLMEGCTLRCFSDSSSLRETTRCEVRKGFRSCYIKYNQGIKWTVNEGRFLKNKTLSVMGLVAEIGNFSLRFFLFLYLIFSPAGSVEGRGCSTKLQIFGSMCENHVIDGHGEEK